MRFIGLNLILSSTKKVKTDSCSQIQYMNITASLQSLRITQHKVWIFNLIYEKEAQLSASEVEVGNELRCSKTEMVINLSHII